MAASGPRVPEPLPPSDRFEAVLASISDGVFTVDRDWRIHCFNRAAEEITGYRREEVLGRPCHEVLRAETCRDACPVRYMQEKGEPVVDLAVHITNRRGERIPVSISTGFLRDRAGKVIGAVETFRDLRQVERLRRELTGRYTFEDIVGKSPRMRELFDLVRTVAPRDSTILIEGESGTGKELFARAIHRLSRRAEGPFVAVNCGALPDALVESELFGHRAGAFTGAVSDHPGRVARAEGGTLFLDEIGEFPLPLQVKLLRFLEEKRYEPLGGARAETADVRIIAASNRNLREMVERGEFRRDLFYRLDVIRLVIPPLRERMEDVPLLVDHFIHRFAALQGRPIRGIAPEALRPLLSHDFPGNVRELANLIEHAFALCPGAVIRPEHLPLARLALPGKEPSGGARTGLEENERRFLLHALESHGWNRQATARALGIHKSTLFRKIRRLGITLPRIDGRTNRNP